jgi:hypothetical protein
MAQVDFQMIWLLSYLASNFALILAVTLCVLALAAIAWFTKNWKAAVAAGVVLIAGSCLSAD